MDSSSFVSLGEERFGTLETEGGGKGPLPGLDAAPSEPLMLSQMGVGEAWSGSEDGSQEDSEGRTLDGKQWCEGRTARVTHNSRAALVLTGQAFRARNFRTRQKLDCSSDSLPVQEMLVNNHLEQIVRPLEAHGVGVDVFLSVTPCCVEMQKNKFKPVNETFDVAAALTQLYGPSRVKGVFPFNRSMGMFDRMADTLLRLDEAMRPEGGTYEYFILLRYDVFLENPLTSLIPGDVDLHKGLSFYMSVHDFMFGFPGELWNCMKTFWDGCMRATNSKGINAIGWDERRKLGCFDFGPLQLPRWAAGYGYHVPLKKIWQMANWPGGRPRGFVEISHQPWHFLGTTAFDAGGRQHACASGWFWPPRSTWEHRFQPYFFRVGSGA